MPSLTQLSLSELINLSASDLFGLPLEVGGYTLSASSGSFTLTGTAANLLVGHAILAGSGSFNLSGTSANLLYGRKVSAASGSFVFTGTAVSFYKGLTDGDPIYTEHSGNPWLFVAPTAGTIKVEFWQRGGEGGSGGSGGGGYGRIDSYPVVTGQEFTIDVPFGAFPDDTGGKVRDLLRGKNLFSDLANTEAESGESATRLGGIVAQADVAISASYQGGAGNVFGGGGSSAGTDAIGNNAIGTLGGVAPTGGGNGGDIAGAGSQPGGGAGAGGSNADGKIRITFTGGGGSLRRQNSLSMFGLSLTI